MKLMVGVLKLVIAKTNSKRISNLTVINKLKLDEKKITKNSYQNFSKRIKKVKQIKFICKIKILQ